MNYMMIKIKGCSKLSLSVRAHIIHYYKIHFSKPSVAKIVCVQCIVVGQCYVIQINHI